MPEKESLLPYVSADIPGIGGRLRSSIEDFQVEEIPAYMPCGEGDHVFAWIEKRGLTSAFLLGELAKGLDIRDSDIGIAGMKDKYAVTRQMVSLPPPITPEAVLALEIEGVKILSAVRHGNKLRTGHLKGNRFILRVRELNCSPQEAESRTNQVLKRLAAVPGAPNWYGAQRFGRQGDNPVVGKALVTGSPIKGRPPRGRQRRMYISAYQSLLFNQYLKDRINDDLFTSLVEGEVLQKRDSGGMFVSDDAQKDQARLSAGELTLTGPMFGHKMKCPAEGSVAMEREERYLKQEEIELQSFKSLGKLAMGTRRALSVLLTGASVAAGDDHIEICFELPSGSYATAIMREIIKGERDFPQ